MATVTHDGLLVCVECTMMIANGELGQGDAAAKAAHAQRMAAQWAGVPGQLVLDDDGDSHYGTGTCDGCGSRVHGDRFAAVVIA